MRVDCRVKRVVGKYSCPAKFICWNLNPHFDGIRRWLGHEMESFWVRLVTLQKRGPKELSHSFHHMRTCGQDGNLWTSHGPSPILNLLALWPWTFQPSEPWGINSCYLSFLAYGNLLQEPRQPIANLSVYTTKVHPITLLKIGGHSAKMDWIKIDLFRSEAWV